MAAAEQNLSGRWSGIFNYPRSLPPTPFEVELRDQAGVLLGETFEIGAGRRNKGRPLNALIEGRRSGSAVSFVKYYDDAARVSTPVYYSGGVNSEATEISGTWDIPGHWSGTFLMIRAKPDQALVELEAAEPVV